MTTTRAKPRRQPANPLHRVTANGIDPRNPWVQVAMRKAVEAEARAAEERRQQARAELASQITKTRLQLYSMAHGQDATEMIAQLMVAIGTPCEAGAQTPGIGRAAPWVRQLHGALRTLQSMCMAGYRWDSVTAHALDRAIEVAEEERDGISVETFARAWVEANGLAAIVLAHQIDHRSIAS